MIMEVNFFLNSIWEYLIELTRDNKTILITTHYIEEARQANSVSIKYRHNFYQTHILL